MPYLTDASGIRTLAQTIRSTRFAREPELRLDGGRFLGVYGGGRTARQRLRRDRAPVLRDHHLLHPMRPNLVKARRRDDGGIEYE